MTTVQIDTSDPRDPRWKGEIRALLDRQPAWPEGWTGRLLEALEAGSPGAFDAFLQAEDGEGHRLGAALLLTRNDAGDPAPRPWLVALWVDPEVRGRGLGRKLVEMAEGHARKRGAAEMVALVPPEDDATLFMWERWGYFRERVLLSRSLEG